MMSNEARSQHIQSTKPILIAMDDQIQAIELVQHELLKRYTADLAQTN